MIIIKKTNRFKYAFTMLLVLTFFSGLTAQELINANEGVFQFEEEVIDYGTIQQGDNGERIFTFTNRGRAPIVITNVKSSCGCTVPTVSKEPIMPGASSEIKVKYDTKRIGVFSKNITIQSNASEGTKIIKIKGTVLKK